MRKSASLIAICSLFAASPATAATLTGSPEPAQACDGTGLVQITVSWNASDISPNPAKVEIHVGAADGPVFAAGQAMGSAATGKWASENTQFFLVNPANKQVLAQYAVHVVNTNCPPPQRKTFWQRLFGK
jgi:hypothetical protein